MTFYTLQYISDWWTLRITRGTAPKFWDLEWVLSWANCFKTYGLDVYRYDDSDRCTGYMYGSNLLRLLNAMNLNENSAIILGLIFMLFFSIILGRLASNLVNGMTLGKSLVLLAFCSPGLWLLVASGNFDILIIISICVSSFLFYKGKFTFSLLFILFATVIKFYTIPLLVFLCVCAPNKRSRIISVFFSALTLFIVYNDLNRIRNNPLFPSQYFFTFGVINPGTWWNILINKLLVSNLTLDTLGKYVLGVSILTLVFGLNFDYKKIRLHKLSNLFLKKYNFSLVQTTFIFFGLTYLGLFIQGANYDYKLFYLAVTGLYFIKIYGIKVTFVVPFYLALWLSCFSFGLQSTFITKVEVSSLYVFIQFFGDVANFFVTGIILVAVIETLFVKDDSQKEFGDK